ncbi:MAG: hypothetical protein IT463_06510 [Planctomycetes bacterium]|nr:hypothetical protein [Planctomycetota bacterium]
MALRLSREPGGVSMLLAQPRWLDPLGLSPVLARALGVPRSDALRALRLQRGIVLEGVPAARVAEVQAALGADVSAIPDAEVPLLPKPIHVSLASCEADGFATPSVAGTGLPKLWDWNELALVSGGLLLDPARQAAAAVERAGADALSQAADRQAIAAQQLEKARHRVFPLGEELRRAEPEFGAALQAALQGGKALPQQEAAGGFGNLTFVLDLVFLRPFERLRLTEKSRLVGPARSSSTAKTAHNDLTAIARHADSATLPGATLALASGADSGDYLFDDLGQFDDYCRWAYYWRLQRLKSESAGKAST